MPQQTLEERIADILGLEIDPEGNKNMLITRDDEDDIIEGISFDDEVDELITLLTSEVQKAREEKLKFPSFQQEVSIIFDEYNEKLNPAFTSADKEHFLRIINKVFEEWHYEIAMLNNL